MILSIIINAFIIGILVSPPIGTIVLISIQRTISKGFIYGFISSLAGCLSDICYGIVISFGITIISKYLIEFKTPLRIISALVLLFIGFVMLKTKVILEKTETIETKTIFEYFISTFIYNSLEPGTILIYTTILPSLGLFNTNNRIINLITVFFLFLGSISWRLVINLIAYKFKDRLNQQTLRILRSLSGIIILITAIYLLSLIILHL